MKLIFSYFKTFNKVILSEKIPFIYSVVVPVCIFVFNNFENLISAIWSVSQLLNQTVNYVGYIIVSVAINGVGMQLINFRESGFLKTYTMISGGDKRYGIIGLVLSELLFGYLSVFSFGFVIGLFYLKNLPLILTFYTISYLFAGLPIFLLAILLGTLPVKVNTISTLANIGLFGMGWLSILRNDTHSILGEVIYGLNPIDYVSQVLLTMNQALRNSARIASYQILAVLILLIIFGGIGIGSISKVRLNSLNMRN